MKDLRINLLGPPEILWENQHFNINRRIPRTLLFFLASQNNLIGRGKLLTMFWQDSDPKAARRRLREALSRIRATIPIPDIIISHNDLVGLNISNQYVDLRKFVELEEALGDKPWSIPSDQTLPEPTTQSMLEAVYLWRGSQFLEGCELPNSALLEDWHYQTNLQLTQKRSRLLTRLCDHYLAAGQYESALNFSRLALESDNLNEDLHFRVLKTLVDLNRIHEAHEYFIAVTKLLNDELAVQPSQQLVSVYRQIQQKTQSISLPARQEWRLLTNINTPYVGREKEANQLKAAMSNGNAILVSGESGLGKTRLIQEFCELYEDDYRILSTHCLPSEINLPFQPFIELLRRYISALEWKSLPSAWSEPLAMLLPEVLPANKTQKMPLVNLSPGQNRSILYEAIRQVFLQISQHNDLILFIDDLHWSDEATIATLAYLIERAPFTENVLLILANRSDEGNESLENILLVNNSKINLEVIELERLKSREVSGLSRYVMGYPLEEGLVDQLTTETGGNPFIILETLRSLQDSESLTKFPGSRLPLPRSVYALIQDRLRKLSPSARNICEFAAVIGTEFDPELISIASNQNLSVTARAIEELNQRQLVEPVPPPPRGNQWHFIHEKIRESVILDTNQIQLRYLHDCIAQAIEEKKSDSGRQAAVLARHYEYAGKAIKAINYWTKAAQWARQLYSTQEAIQILSHAERLMLNTEEEKNDQLIHDLYNDWTELAYEIQDAGMIREQNNRLLELGQSNSNNLLIGTALDGLSDACMIEDQFKEGLAYTNQAINYLKQTSHAYEIMKSYTLRGVYLYMSGRLNEAIESFEHALSYGNSTDDPEIQRGLANVHYQLALSHTLAGWPEVGLENAKISLELAKKIGHHHIAVTAYLASSLARYFLADYHKARQDNLAGIEIAERLHANRMLGYLYVSKAFLDTTSGDLGAAYKTSHRILELGIEHNHQDLLSLAHRSIGDIFLLLDSHMQAREAFELGSKFGGHDFWGLDNRVRLGYSQLKTGDPEIGMDNLLRGIDLAHSAGFGQVEIRGLQFLSYAHAARMEWELTRQVAEKIIRQARIRNLPIEGLLGRFIGEVAEFNLSKSAEDLELLQYLLNFLLDKEQPYIALRILHQMITVKKILGIDTHMESQRIADIFHHCQPLASPSIIQKAFQIYKKQIEFSIKG